MNNLGKIIGKFGFLRQVLLLCFFSPLFLVANEENDNISVSDEHGKPNADNSEVHSEVPEPGHPAPPVASKSHDVKKKTSHGSSGIKTPVTDSKQSPSLQNSEHSPAHAEESSHPLPAENLTEKKEQGDSVVPNSDRVKDHSGHHAPHALEKPSDSHGSGHAEAQHGHASQSPAENHSAKSVFQKETHPSGTAICGKVMGPTSLSLKKSPYVLTGDLWVAPNARLTFEPGVIIKIAARQTCRETMPQTDPIDSQFISIKIEGAFYVNGNVKNFVRIIPEDTADLLNIKWDGIHIFNRGMQTVQMQYFEIRGAQRGIYSSNSRFNVANGLFINNNTGLYLIKGGNLNVFNCLFSQNISAGIYIEKSYPKIYANIFYQNDRDGIWSDSRTKMIIRYNNFYQNADHHCYRCPAGVGVPLKDKKGGNADEHMNIFSDPLFEGSWQDSLARLKDLRAPTPKKDVKDTVMHNRITQAHEKSKAGLPKQPQIQRLGQGPWVLSPYSKAINAAPDHEFFMDASKTRHDIGLFGGRQGRVASEFPY